MLHHKSLPFSLYLIFCNANLLLHIDKCKT